MRVNYAAGLCFCEPVALVPSRKSKASLDGEIGHAARLIPHLHLNDTYLNHFIPAGRNIRWTQLTMMKAGWEWS